MGELARRKSKPTQALPQTKQGIYEIWGNPLGMLGTLEGKGSPRRRLGVWGLLYTGCWGSLSLEHSGLSLPSVLSVLSSRQVLILFLATPGLVALPFLEPCASGIARHRDSFMQLMGRFWPLPTVVFLCPTPACSLK